jgi:hypothetical protein
MHYFKRFSLPLGFLILLIGLLLKFYGGSWFISKSDLKWGNQYVERLIALNEITHDSCTSEGQKNQRQMLLMYALLEGLVEAHPQDKSFYAIKLAVQNFKSNKSQSQVCKTLNLEDSNSPTSHS